MEEHVEETNDIKFIEKQIIDLCDQNVSLSPLDVLVHAIAPLRHINNWARINNIHITFRQQLKLSALTGIIFKDLPDPSTKNLFFEAIALQRYWDDLYDENLYPAQELLAIRNFVLEGGNTSLPIAYSFRKVYSEIHNQIRNGSSYFGEQLANGFVESLKDILDGYEYEQNINLQNVHEIKIQDYLAYSQNSLALKYVLFTIGSQYIKTEQDMDQFNNMFMYERSASRAIRLANDISSYHKEKHEGKLNYLSIRELQESKSYDQIKEEALQQIYKDLVVINEIKENNIYINIIKRITFSAVQRYIKQIFD